MHIGSKNLAIAIWQPSLVKELLARRVGLDGELELGVDGRDAHVHGLRHLESFGGSSSVTSHTLGLKYEWEIQCICVCRLIWQQMIHSEPIKYQVFHMLVDLCQVEFDLGVLHYNIA